MFGQCLVREGKGLDQGCGHEDGEDRPGSSGSGRRSQQGSVRGVDAGEGRVAENGPGCQLGCWMMTQFPVPVWEPWERASWLPIHTFPGNCRRSSRESSSDGHSHGEKEEAGPPLLSS